MNLLATKKSHFIFRLFVILLGFVTFSIGFQNCSSQVNNNSLESTKQAPLVLQGDVLNQVPFAFDNVINEIAYMSCSNTRFTNGDKNSMSDPAFFTFQAKATSKNSGIGIRSEFRDFLLTQFGDSKFIVPDDTLTRAFTDAPANANASLQFSVRQMRDPTQTIQSYTSSAPALETDYNSFISTSIYTSSLTYDQNLTKMKELFYQPLTTRVNDFTEVGTDHILSTSLNFFKSSTYDETQAKLLRNSFSNNINFLAVTYSNDLNNPDNLKNPFFARPNNSVANNKALVWGRGYQATFKNAPSAAGIGYPNVLQNIIELDLSTGLKPTGDQWNCNIAYLIKSPYDNKDDSTSTSVGTVCKDPILGTGNISPAQENEYNIIANYLTPTDWIIDPVQKCVVPKTNVGECYPNRNPATTNRQILYKNDGSSSACGTLGTNTTKDCPEFLSICIRVSK